MKTTLAEKKNRININDAKRTFNVNLTTERTVMFLAVEKNGQLAPAAQDALEWCKKNGFEMTSRPVKKPKIKNEFFEGKTQEVACQLTSYIIK